MTTDTTNSGAMHNATNLQATAPQSQSEDPNLTTARNANNLDSASGGNQTSFASSDPTTAPHAKPTSKITGDLKGMAQGVAGSMQAVVGTTFGQKAMAEKGFEKMSEEDARLAAKSGKPPVGTDQRDTTVEAGQTGGEYGRGLPTQK